MGGACLQHIPLTLNALVFSAHGDLSLPPNDTRDTSMTATMLLHDSMLKPSVFRSPSETQGHPPKFCKLHETCKETTVFQLRNVTQTNTSYAFQWFCSECSSAPLGSLPCPARQKRKYDWADQVRDEWNMGAGATVAVTPTSPASCLKTWRNCLSSSLSCCSAYTAGLRGGGYNTAQ